MLANSRIALLLLSLFLGFLRVPEARANTTIEAITFALEPGLIYTPVDEAAKALHWETRQNDAGQCIQIREMPIPAGSLRCLNDGTELVTTGDLQKAGAEVVGTTPEGPVTVKRGFRSFVLSVGAKQVEVSLANQQLQAWQGSRLVLQCHISSGRHNGTPAGNYTAGPYRARMHYSHLFQNAPMPWSVQINGHIFIHGFTSVPDYPASHGCIRMPLDGRNPAKFFYEWVDTGSPVRVVK